MSRPICFDLINKVLQEVGTLKQNQQYKDNMDKVVDLIKTHCQAAFLDDAEVSYIYDAHGNAIGVEKWYDI